MIAVLAALAAAFAVLLATASSPRARDRPPAQGSSGPESDEGLLLRLRPVLVVLACLAGWSFVGGGAGVVAGLALAVVSWRILGDVEPPSRKRRREQLARQLPVGVQLLATALRAGADIESALVMVATALPGAVGEELAGLARQLRLGLDPERVWARAAENVALAPLARTLGRAQETGAAVAEVMEALAAELQGQRRAAVEQVAKSVDVRASAPLGLCLLPAFMVLGVAPLVVGVFASLQLLP